MNPTNSSASELFKALLAQRTNGESSNLKHHDVVVGIYQGAGLASISMILNDKNSFVPYTAKYEAQIVASELKQCDFTAGSEYQFLVIKDNPEPDGDESWLSGPFKPGKRKYASDSKRIEQMAQLSSVELNRWQASRGLVKSGREVQVKAVKLLKSRTNKSGIAGLMVTVDDASGKLLGFIPYSELGRKNIRRNELEELLDLNDDDPALTVKALEFDGKRGAHGCITFSQRAVMAEQEAQKRSSLKVGQLVQGRIVNVTDFGLFIDIGVGIDGLLHKNNMEEDPTTKKIGESIEVTVMHFNVNSEKLSFTTRTVNRHLEEVKEQFAVGTRHQGRVVNSSRTGAVVVVPIKVGPKQEDSEIQGYLMHFETCGVVAKGGLVNVQVINQEIESKRLLFSVKAVNREKFFATVKRGDVLEGTVKNTVTVGAFVTLDSSPPYEGFLYLPGRVSVNKGDRVKVKIHDLKESINQVKLTLVNVFERAEDTTINNK